MQRRCSPIGILLELPLSPTFPSSPSLVNHQESAHRILDCTLSPGQAIMTPSKANGYGTNKQVPVQRPAERPSHKFVPRSPDALAGAKPSKLHIPVATSDLYVTNHDYVHAEMLQTAIHVRIASIIACRHSRFCSRRLRHRLHTGWPKAKALPLQAPRVDNQHRCIQLLPQTCMQKTLEQ